MTRRKKDTAPTAENEFEGWWKKTLKKDSRWLIDFGASQAFKAGWDAANRAYLASRKRRGK